MPDSTSAGGGDTDGYDAVHVCGKIDVYVRQQAVAKRRSRCVAEPTYDAAAAQISIRPADAMPRR